ncbi:MAG: DUF4838 domain-containing protein [Armatimonadota bacterium]|jgi:hypothetical protein
MRQITLVLAMALLGAATAGAAPVTLVDNGAPLACVVVPEEAPDRIGVAAAELVDCVREASGAELEIVSEPVDGMAAIHIGTTPYARSLSIEIGSESVDAYTIRFPGDDTIVIVGNSSQGTEFGVYGFLRRFLDVRWLLPGTDGRDVPVATTITIADEPVSDEPAFISRLFSGGRGAHNDWAVRNGMRGTISFHHNLRRLFDWETYPETHPHFYPIINGERLIPTREEGWQPCFTAEGIVEEAVRVITAYFDEDPSRTSYSLGINDNRNFCQCENCMAKISGDTNFLGNVDYSDLYYEWCNEVVEGVLENHPDKYFGLLAYNNVVEPPSNVTLHPRIIPYMTYDRMKWVHPAIEEHGRQLTRDWAEAASTIGWYDYIYGTPYCLPRYYPHKMAEYLRWGYEQGVRALYAEAYPNFGEGPKLYVYLALNWDPYVDVDALLDEWFERTAGPESADALRAYYEFWEHFWTERIVDSAWFTEGGQYLRFNTPSYLADVTPEEIAQCRAWIDEVVANAGTEKQRARAELLARAFEYYEASALAYPRDDDAENPPATEAEALVRLEGSFEPVAYAQKRLNLAVEFEDDPVLVHPLPPTRYPATTGSSWGTNRMWQLYEWVQQSDAVRARITELAATSEFELVRQNASLLLKVATGEAQPINANHSFEDGNDWATGWTGWVKDGIGRHYRTTEIAHTGEASMCFDGMQRGGPHQTLRLEPGEYALTGFAYVPEEVEKLGTVALQATPRDEAGNNLPGGISTQIIPAKGRWQPIAAAGTIPAQVGGKPVASVLFLPIVDGWAPNGLLYIDDLSIVKLD